MGALMPSIAEERISNVTKRSAQRYKNLFLTEMHPSWEKDFTTARFDAIIGELSTLPPTQTAS